MWNLEFSKEIWTYLFVLGMDMAAKLTFLINIAGRLGENVICLMASSTGSPLI